MNYTYPNYLCHYGVKGMKWGRRKRYSGGVTKNGKPVSNRKVKKGLYKLNSNPGKNLKQVQDKMDHEYVNSKEYQALVKNAYSKGFTTRQLENALDRKAKIGRKYAEANKSAALKDLGYDDTKAGRDFVVKVAEEYMKKHSA